MGTIISAQKAFIFIHIPKTAGLSLASVLEPYRRNAWLDRKPLRAAIGLAGIYTGLPAERLFRGRVIPEHAGLNDLIRLCPDLVPEHYLKFAVVRNPWDRVASAFAYGQIARSRHLRPGYWQTRGMDFSGWLAHHAARLAAGRVQSQFAMVCDPAGQGVAVDRLLRFETLAEDVPPLLRTLGLPDAALPRLNRSANTDYRRRYSDADAERVAQIYADDIRAFGYSF